MDISYQFFTHRARKNEIHDTIINKTPYAKNTASPNNTVFKNLYKYEMHISTLEQLCIGMRWRMEMGTGDKWE